VKELGKSHFNGRGIVRCFSRAVIVGGGKLWLVIITMSDGDGRRRVTGTEVFI